MSFHLGLTTPITYLITSGRSTNENFEKAAQEIIGLVTRAGALHVSMVQLREKALSGRRLFELAQACTDALKGSETRLLINDRADIAAAAGCDGVHLTETSMPIRVIRESFGNEILIGASTHTPEKAVAARSDGADFAVYGPVFATPGKGKPAGLDSLAGVCGNVKGFPVLGLGGVDADNCRAVLAAGAAGVAGIRSFVDPASLRSIMQSLRT